MVVHLLYFKADLDNVDSVQFPEDHEWLLGFRDNSGDERKNVCLCATESIDIPGSRGSANLLLKFPSGNSSASISVVPVKGIDRKYTKSGEFQAVLAIESRGAEPFEWKPTGFYTAETKDEKIFDNVDIKDGDWCDFDEDASCSVGIYNAETKIEIYRGK